MSQKTITYEGQGRLMLTYVGPCPQTAYEMTQELVKKLHDEIENHVNSDQPRQPHQHMTMRQLTGLPIMDSIDYETYRPQVVPVHDWWHDTYQPVYNLYRMMRF